MATYSRAQRMEAIRRAGFSETVAPIALAISLAEFGENRDIGTQSQSDYVKDGVREKSFGPWQIHLPAHPANQPVWQGADPLPCALDLQCSTDVAYRLSKGGSDFGPWSAFTNGSYQRFLVEIMGGATNATPTPIVPTTPTVTHDVDTTPSPTAFPTPSFPTIDVAKLGPWTASLDSGLLVKIAVTFGAIFLLFKGVVTLTAGESNARTS